ncbi:MAG: TonB-dependent receptor [Gemmatimonadales bacterium]|nr:MAG: TonB-dependent receptor [Gemmatimonadales bacterium]
MEWAVSRFGRWGSRSGTWLGRVLLSSSFVMGSVLIPAAVEAGTEADMEAAPFLASQQVERGTITGVVRNEQGHALRGAAVQVRELNLSVATDDRGDFRMARVPSGRHEMQVSYLGYATRIIEVDVAAGEVVRLEVELAQDAIALQGITVEASERYTQFDALNEQRTAESLRNIVSREQMERFPDNHVPDAIRRIPGVAVSLDRGEPSGIYVRGLSPSMTTVEIDGQRVPSTSQTGRAPSLGGINAEMIESMELVKAVTPDMDADATAGAIRLRSRRPASRSIRGNFGTEYQALTSEPGGRGSISFADRIGQTSFVLGANYSNQDHTNDDVQYTWRMEDFGAGPERILNRLRVSVYPERRVRYGLDGRVEHRFSPQTLAFFRGMMSWHSQRAERHRYNVELRRGTFLSATEAVGARAERQARHYERNRNIFSFSTGAEHEFSWARFDATAGFSRSERHEPYRDYLQFRHRDGVDARFVRNDPLLPELEFMNGTSLDRLDEFGLQYFETRPDLMRDREVTFDANLEIPYEIGDNPGFFRFGTKWADKDRFRDYPRVRFEDLAMPFTMGDLEAANAYERRIAGGRYNLGSIVDWDQAERWVEANRENMAARANRTRSYDTDDYEAAESVLAGYGMTSVRFGDLQFIGGVRVEQTRLNYLGNQVIYDSDGDFAETVLAEASQSYVDLFPMLNFRYLMGEDTNLRFAWSNTIVRPSFISIAPYETRNIDSETISRGNPELPPARSMNWDLTMDHYFQSVGFLSAGVFLKSMRDFAFTFTELVDAPGSEIDGFELRRPEAGNAARAYGVEVAWQQQMNFLPGGWSGLGLLANYTWTGSTTDFDDPGYDERNLPLPRQVPHIANVALSYDRGGFSGNVSWNYQGTQLHSVQSDADNDRWLDARYQIDLSASQVLPFATGARLYAEVNNLTGQDQLRYRGDVMFPDRYNIYGTRVLAGVRWAF